MYKNLAEYECQLTAAEEVEEADEVERLDKAEYSGWPFVVAAEGN